MDRYENLANAFVSLADTLVADYDVVELAHQLVDSSMALLPVDAVGIVLVDPLGDVHVLASSSEQTRLLEVFQIQADAGPCLQAYRTGQPVVVDDLTVDPNRWPAFAERAGQYGFEHYTFECSGCGHSETSSVGWTIRPPVPKRAGRGTGHAGGPITS